MDPRLEHQMRLTRRQLFGLASGGIGTAALAALLSEDLRAGPPKRQRAKAALPPARRRCCRTCRTSPPKAKRVIYLFQSGGPSQMDLFDYKPRLNDLRGTESARLDTTWGSA